MSLDPIQRSFFPLVEFRDAAKWFARRGYFVVAPVGTGYGASAIDIPERGLYGPFFSKVGKCANPNFRDAGLAVAQVDLWIIDFLAAEKRITPKDVVVVGQSAGGWASIALSSMRSVPSGDEVSTVPLVTKSTTSAEYSTGLSVWMKCPVSG